MASYDVKGKVALITGAGSGLSLALAQRLLKEGCSVMIADLALRPEAEATVAAYPHPPPLGAAVSAAFHRTDVTDWAQLNALWAATQGAFGHIDILVNGAGIFEAPWTSFWHPPGVSAQARDPVDATVGTYNIFNINATAPIRLAQMALDYWLEHRDTTAGNLLWVSSMGAYIHSIQTPLYFASKAAVVSVAKSLQGLKQLVGIRNSVVCPGPTRTPLFHQEFCRDRLGADDLALSAEDAANVMLALLTEEQYGNGNVVEVMMVGTLEKPEVYQREVPMEALYPTANPMGGQTKAMEVELQFMGAIKEKGMRQE